MEYMTFANINHTLVFTLCTYYYTSCTPQQWWRMGMGGGDSGGGGGDSGGAWGWGGTVVAYGDAVVVYGDGGGDRVGGEGEETVVGGGGDK